MLLVSPLPEGPVSVGLSASFHSCYTSPAPLSIPYFQKNQAPCFLSFRSLFLLPYCSVHISGWYMQKSQGAGARMGLPPPAQLLSVPSKTDASSMPRTPHKARPAPIQNGIFSTSAIPFVCLFSVLSFYPFFFHPLFCQLKGRSSSPSSSVSKNLLSALGTACRSFPAVFFAPSLPFADFCFPVFEPFSIF